MSPRVVAQGLRAPSVAVVDPTLGTANGAMQLRVGLSLSVTDYFRAANIATAAEAECDRHAAQRRIEELLVQVNDIGKAAALAQQVAYLELQSKEWQALKTTAKQRLTEGAITVIDYNEIEKRLTSFDRRLAEQRGEAERIAARGYAKVDEAFGALTELYLAQTVRYEHALAEGRTMSAWDLRVSGGVVPFQAAVNVQPVGRPDWYMLTELSVNPGLLFSDQRTVIAAREREAQESPYELVQQLASFKRETTARLEQARRELESITRQAASTGGARQLLQQSEAANSAQALTLLRLDEVWLEAERAYLMGLVDELTQVLDRTARLVVRKES